MRKKAVLIIAALALFLSTSIGTAWAYFTTCTEASGGFDIHLGSKTEIAEEVSSWAKHLSVSNEADSSEAIFVRAIAFGPKKYPLVYSGDGWTPGADGYYYYMTPVEPGGSTAVLDVHITEIPEKNDDGETFNVVVLYESIPVSYTENGELMSPMDADWTVKLDAGASAVLPAEPDTEAENSGSEVSADAENDGEEVEA